MDFRVVWFIIMVMVLTPVLTWKTNTPDENWNLIFFPDMTVNSQHVENVRSEEQCVSLAYKMAARMGDPVMRKSNYVCGKNPRKLTGGTPINPANVVGGYEYDILTK